VWTVELTDLKLVGDDDDNDIDVPEYDEMTVRARGGGREGGKVNPLGPLPLLPSLPLAAFPEDRISSTPPPALFVPKTHLSFLFF